MEDTLLAVSQLVASMRTARGYVARAVKREAQSHRHGVVKADGVANLVRTGHGPPIEWETAVSMCRAAAFALRFAPRLRAQALAWKEEAQIQMQAQEQAQASSSQTRQGHGLPGLSTAHHAGPRPPQGSPLARQRTALADFGHAQGTTAGTAERGPSPSRQAVDAARGAGSADALELRVSERADRIVAAASGRIYVPQGALQGSAPGGGASPGGRSTGSMGSGRSGSHRGSVL